MKSGIGTTTNGRQLQALIELSFDVFCLWRADGCLQPLNPAIERVLGWTEAELKARPWIEFVHPEDVATTLAAIARCNEFSAIEFKQRCKHRDGSDRTLVWRIRCDLDDGIFYGVASAFTEMKLVEGGIEKSEITDFFSPLNCESSRFNSKVKSDRAAASSDRSEELYRTLAQNFPNGAVVLFDLNCRYLIAEGKGLSAVGLSRELMEGKTNEEIFPQQVCQAIAPIYQEALAGKDTILELLYKNNFYSIHALPLKNERGEIYAGMGVISDITERKQAEAALQQQAERERLLSLVRDRIRQSLDLETILNTTVAEVRQFLQTDRVLIYRFQPDWSGIVAVESVDDHWTPLLGTILHSSEHTKNCISYYQKGHIYDAEDVSIPGTMDRCHLDLFNHLQVKGLLIVPILQGSKGAIELSIEGAEEQYFPPSPHPPLSPSALWGLLIAHHCRAPRKWQSLEIDWLVSLANQLAIAIQQAELYQQLALANRELQRLATCDCLTQVANRRRFDEYFEQEWQRAASDRVPLSLLLCDVDFFKIYNDTYGHLVGDECLQQVAVAISEAIALPTDISTNLPLVARYGGEEFAVILPNMNSQEALSVAESIRSALLALALPHKNSAVSEFITLSIGIGCVVPQFHESAASLIAAADEALYRAKAQGRDRVVVNFCISSD